jgi:hypothetical protein
LHYRNTSGILPTAPSTTKGITMSYTNEHMQEQHRTVRVVATVAFTLDEMDGTLSETVDVAYDRMAEAIMAISDGEHDVGLRITHIGPPDEVAGAERELIA